MNNTNAQMLSVIANQMRTDPITTVAKYNVATLHGDGRQVSVMYGFYSINIPVDDYYASHTRELFELISLWAKQRGARFLYDDALPDKAIPVLPTSSFTR
jgi:hypothetical protein